MTGSRPFPLRIWALAFGYFAFYIPYSALTKALSQGLLAGVDGPVPGFLFLPATAIATTAGLLAFIAATGGWSHLARRTVSGRAVPSIRAATLGSGLATAVIIGTTTLNYTSTGISILLALLLMRGGVLAIAPVVDALSGRRIRPQSWVALALSFAAIGVALSEVHGYRMTLAAGLIIAAYLGGYAVRLNLMSRLAKSADPQVNRRYFYEETAVAAVALTAVPALIAAFGSGEVAGHLRAGFTTFLATKAALPALAIGGLYACLYVFGTGVYLDGRENTFCVPLNRCASLLSGLVASLGLTFLFGWRPPSAYQLVGAGLILGALIFLMAATLRDAGRAATTLGQRIYLFVCGGNTSRSPMAQAICNDEIARRLGLGRGPVMAISAGLTATPGRPLTGPSIAALNRVNVTPHDHASRVVTEDLVDSAEIIFCMTEGQRRELVERFPGAGPKSRRLDPEADISDPSGLGQDAYDALAERLQDLVRRCLPSLGGLA